MEGHIKLLIPAAMDLAVVTGNVSAVKFPNSDLAMNNISPFCLARSDGSQAVNTLVSSELLEDK